MIDSHMVGSTFNEPTHWTGRFTGAGNTVPVAVAFTSRKLKIARSGVGALTVTMSDPTLGQSGNGNTGVVQVYDFWVNTSLVGGANVKQVCVSPIAANSATFTLQVQFANGTAVDLTSSDELQADIWTSRSSAP